MTKVEYKVIPAPTKGRKAPGLKTAEARFAFAVQELMNALAAEGWRYLRADLLPSEERQGLASSHTVYRSVLVFEREIPTSPARTADKVEPSAETMPVSGPAIIPAPPPRPDVPAQSLAPETGTTVVQESSAEKSEDKLT